MEVSSGSSGFSLRVLPGREHPRHRAVFRSRQFFHRQSERIRRMRFGANPNLEHLGLLHILAPLTNAMTGT